MQSLDVVIQPNEEALLLRRINATALIGAVRGGRRAVPT